MRRLLLLLLLTLGAAAQTTVYLRSSGPPAVLIHQYTNGAPCATGVQCIQTAEAHGMDPGCGTTKTCWVTVSGLVSDAGSGNCPVYGSNVGQVESAAGSGHVATAKYVDATHYGMYDTTGVPTDGTSPYIGTAIAPNGAFCDGQNYYNVADAAISAQVNPFTLPAQPLGWLDGPNGPMMRRLALTTTNGLTSVVVAANLATVTTGYDHGLSTGDRLSFWNTTSSALNTVNGAGVGSPYTVTVTSPTTFTFPTTGVSDGNYTVNAHCGPGSNTDAKGNYLIGTGSTQNCVVVSQIAWVGNVIYDALQAEMVRRYATGSDLIAGNYKPQMYGGLGFLGIDELGSFGMIAVMSMVDRANTYLQTALLWGLENLPRLDGVNWTLSESATLNTTYNDTTMSDGGEIGGNVAWMYIAGVQAGYLTNANKTILLNQLNNDIVDPLAVSSTIDAAPQAPTISTGHTAQAGSSNTVTLASSESLDFTHTLIYFPALGGYGTVSSYNTGTKVATISGTWGGSGNPTTGTAYVIYPTITISSTTAGATATVTGYNTAFTSQFSTGDAVVGGWGDPSSNSGWNPDNAPSAFESVITGIGSNTSMTVVNSSNVSWNFPDSVTPRQLFIVRQWQTGDVGWRWLHSHTAAYGAQPATYPPGGGVPVYGNGFPSGDNYEMG